MLLFLDPRSRIRDKHAGSATLLFSLVFVFFIVPLFCKELKRGGREDREDGGQPGCHGRPPWRGPGPCREGGRLHQVPYPVHDSMQEPLPYIWWVRPSVADPDPGFRIRIHFFRIQIRIQRLRLETNTDPDPDLIQSGSRSLMAKNWKKLQLKKNLNFFWSNIAIYLSLGLHKVCPSYRRSLQLSKEAIQHFKSWTFTNFFLLLSVILPSWIRVRIRIPNPDPDQLAHLNPDPIRIRIHVFLGLLDLDPLVRGMDPDPDASIIKH